MSRLRQLAILVHTDTWGSKTVDSAGRREQSAGSHRLPASAITIRLWRPPQLALAAHHRVCALCPSWPESNFSGRLNVACNLSASVSCGCLPSCHCGRVTLKILEWHCRVVVLGLSPTQSSPSQNDACSNCLWQHGGRSTGFLLQLCPAVRESLRVKPYALFTVYNSHGLSWGLALLARFVISPRSCQHSGAYLLSQGIGLVHDQVGQLHPVSVALGWQPKCRAG